MSDESTLVGLELRLLGPFQLAIDGCPAAGFESDKVRALLAYLAVESDRPQRREKLAGLLWPDFPERSARTNLRRALANLRQVIGDPQADPPFLHISRQAIQFNRESDAWVDAAAFLAAVTPAGGRTADIPTLEAAASWYQGAFLEGFSLPDSAPFEEWARLTREALQRALLGSLERLAEHYQKLGAYDQALAYARRQVELEPYREEGQQQVMRLLALSGRRGQALAQYEALQQMLAQELGVAPAAETSALFQQIRDDQLKPGTAEPGPRAVRGYEVRDRLGAGSFGVVYRAFQPAVERDVAIKIIRPGFANHPDFIRLFEAEAQLVARLEHPHIVPLYDFWREPDGAFLVMRWLRGGSLGSALARGPWKAEMAARLMDQVAAAVTVAHRQGVVHRDIKPSNILLDEEGNAYLSDFGLARLIEPIALAQEPAAAAWREAALASQGYQSPELVQEDKSTPQADVYSLGVVAYELLTGQHPFPDTSPAALAEKQLRELLPPVLSVRPELPPAVDAVIQRATAKNLPERYPDAASLAQAFRQALLPQTAIPARTTAIQADIRNPYKGLRSFQEADAADFFGRQALVAQLLRRLDGADEPGEQAAGRFLAVVGPSGSGKSSVVKAGLLPALRQGALPGSERWYLVEMVPGSHPLEELELALLQVAVNPPADLSNQIRGEARGLLRLVRRLLPDDQSRLLLLIDQFEELFTLVASEKERLEFLERIVTAVTDARSRLSLVITLRADFYDRPLLYPDLGRLVQAQTATVLPLSVEELQQAIAGPAGQVGTRLEAGLDAAIVADVSEQPGALPLLQYALTELFERRAGQVLTLAAYQESGGVLGALARRAETLFTGLDEAGRQAAQQLFLRLVNLGEGSEDTRRRALRTELISAAAHPELTAAVIDTFGRYRLLTFDHQPETRAPTVEVAHEALLHAWQRLRRWIDEGRESLRWQRRLAEAAGEWEQGGRDASYLLQGSRLDQFVEWEAATELGLTALERAFLQASVDQRQQRAAAEAARQARERALERRSVHRLRLLVAVLVVATLITALSAARAISQSQLAQRQARASRSRELATAALNNLDTDPELSIWLALMAAETTRAGDGLVLPEAEQALHRAVQRSRALLTLPGPYSASFSPDGRRLATAGENNTAKIWDLESGQALLTLAGHTNDSLGVFVSFSRDGSRLVTASFDGTAKIWEATTGALLTTLAGHDEGLYTAIFSPDGRYVATSSADGTARLWEADTGQQRWVLDHQAETFGMGFSPDGGRLAVASFGMVATVWDTSSGEQLMVLSGHTADVNDVVFSPDGQLLATASADTLVKLWDAASGEEIRTLSGHTGFVNAVEFSPDGGRLATGSADSTAKIWDPQSGRELLTLAGHSSVIWNVAFSPDGEQLATSSQDRTTKVWDLGPPGREWMLLRGHTDVSFSVEYHPDGERLASASWDGTARLWEAASGRELQRLEHEAPVNRVAFDATGRRLATASKDGWIKVWDVASGQEQLAIEVVDDLEGDLDVAFSPDGRLLASGDGHGEAILWDASSGAKLRVLAGHEDFVFRLAFSPDGNYLATAGFMDNTAKLWEVASGRELMTLSVFEATVTNVAFDPGSTRLAVTSWDATARVWELDALLQADAAAVPDPVLTLEHDAPIWDVAFSDDGQRLATSSFDGAAKIWDATTGQQLLLLPESNNGPDITFSPGGDHLATTSGDGAVRLYVLPVEQLMALASSRLTRPPTAEECLHYLQAESCPPLPAPLSSE